MNKMFIDALTALASGISKPRTPEQKARWELLDVERHLIKKSSIKDILEAWGMSLENVCATGKRRSWQNFSHEAPLGGYLIRISFDYKINAQGESITDNLKLKALKKLPVGETVHE